MSLIESGIGTELGGRAGQRKQRQRGMLLRSRSQECGIVLVERELETCLGGWFLVGIRRFFLLNNQSKMAGLLVIEPDGVGAGRCWRQGCRKLQRIERICKPKGHGLAVRPGESIDRLIQLQETLGQAHGTAIERQPNLKAIARFQGSRS